jgi:hypothetical protein
MTSTKSTKQSEPTRVSKGIPWWTFEAIADETPMRKHVALGGLGAGKSHGGQIWDLYRSLQNGVDITEPKPSQSWTVAPNYRICDTLLELTMQVAQDVFGMREGVHYDLRRSYPREIDLSKSQVNHRMLFLSASNPEHFVSASITHWRWSEVGVSKAETLEKLTDRLRDGRAKILQGLCDGTPETLNHFNDLAGFCGWNRDALDAEKNVRVFRIETEDNAKNLAPGYLENIQNQYGYSKEKLLSYTKGIFTNHFANSAHWEFIPSRNVLIPVVDPSPSLDIGLTFDFNVSPLAWVVCQKFNVQRNYMAPREDKYVAVREANGTARGLMDAIADFGQQFPVSQYAHTPIKVYGDASGWARNIHTAGSDYAAIESYLRALGYQRVEILAARSNPLVKHRLERVAALMAYERFAVSENCKNLIRSFTRTLLKPGTFEIEKPSGEDITHFADACDYYLYQVSKDSDIANPRARRIIGTS